MILKTHSTFSKIRVLSTSLMTSKFLIFPLLFISSPFVFTIVLIHNYILNYQIHHYLIHQLASSFLLHPRCKLQQHF